jgi:hypothetical protein
MAACDARLVARGAACGDGCTPRRLCHSSNIIPPRRNVKLCGVQAPEKLLSCAPHPPAVLIGNSPTLMHVSQLFVDERRQQKHGADALPRQNISSTWSLGKGELRSFSSGVGVALRESCTSYEGVGP